jgi:hypothetical protein
MTKRALIVTLGEVYGLEINGYSPVNSLQNTTRMSSRLTTRGWDNLDPLNEKNATKLKIQQSIDELKALSKPGDYLLFYYFGHCDKFDLPGSNETNGDDSKDEYLINYDSRLFGQIKPFSTDYFFSDNDYFAAMNSFLQQKPGVFLVSIFDCCFSKGMADGSLRSQPNHTVMCSSAEIVSSWADRNDGSFFNKALCNAAPFNQTMTGLFSDINADLKNRNLPEPFLKLGTAMPDICIL